MRTPIIKLPDGQLGVALPRSVLELLGLGEGVLVEVTTDDVNLILRPAGRAEAPAPEPGGVELVAEIDGRVVASAPFAKDALVIGRGREADLCVEERSGSRRPARVARRGASFWVVDLGSANGTQVNGARIEAPHRLHAGDVVQLGHCRLRLEGVSEAKARLPMLTLRGPEGTHRFGIVGDAIVIGRDEACDICVRDRNISRQHVRITAEGDFFLVEDLGSQNGTLYKGQRLRGPVHLAAGDWFSVCDRIIELGFHEAPAAEEGAPDRTMLVDRAAIAQAAYIDGDEQPALDVALHRFALGPRDDGEWGTFQAMTGEVPRMRDD